MLRWVTGKVQTIVASPRGAFLKPVSEEVEVTDRIQNAKPGFEESSVYDLHLFYSCLFLNSVWFLKITLISEG